MKLYAKGSLYLKTPFAPGYRPTLWFPQSNIRSDVELHPPQYQWVQPGELVKGIRLGFYFPQNVASALDAGERDFFLCEGNRIVALGSIQQLFESAGEAFTGKEAIS